MGRLETILNSLNDVAASARSFDQHVLNLSEELVKAQRERDELAEALRQIKRQRNDAIHNTLRVQESLLKVRLDLETANGQAVLSAQSEAYVRAELAAARIQLAEMTAERDYQKHRADDWDQSAKFWCDRYFAEKK